ncbi:amino acid adenylation domain-containing protein [Saccharicrinis sp. FJH54]|uniref:non-ribosomal peptide synthetase n=1 Tax=Saccharicrinis sp. FJH54 TaxID=3344665 RepID=UPI0035D3DBC9
MYQLTRNQEHFWLQHNINSHNAALHIPLLYKFHFVNVAALKFAISQLSKKHVLLRTKFTHIKGQPFQYSHENVQLDDILQIENFNGDAPSDFEYNEALPFVHRPFNLNTELAWRVKLHRYKNVSYLSLVFHHILIDLHSKRIFCRDLEEYYNSFPAQKKSEEYASTGLSNDYFNYCEWQSEWLISSNANQQRIIWQKELKGNLNPIKLPADKVHNYPKIFIKGKRFFFEIDPNTSDGINSYSAENALKPFVVFMAAYAITLHKFSGQQKIYVGVPFTNRRKQEYADTFGCFINILPVSVSIDKETTVSDLINQIRGSLLRIHRIQELPFLELHETKQDNNDGNIFDVGFTFEDKVPLTLGNQHSDQIVLNRDGAQMELFMTMWRNERTYGGFWEFNESNYSVETIKTLNETIAIICQNLSFIENKKISSLSLIPDSGKRLIDEYNNTKVPLPDRLITEYITDHKNALPQKTAIICGEKKINYQELEINVNQLANFLTAKDIGENDTIGVCMDRSVDMVICMLSLLKIGATFLPLDPEFPSDRLSYMLNDSVTKLVLTQEHLKDKFTENNTTCIFYSSAYKDFTEQNKSFTHPVSDMQSGAYMLYTSGSTGKPKGVKIHHEAFLNFLLSMSIVPGFREKDVLLAVTTISFDIAFLELFLPLIKGGSVVIAESKDVLNGKKLIELIDKHNVTCFQATPGRWNILLQTGWKGKMNLKALVGGEVLPVQLIKKLLPKVKELWNMYGPTETTIWSTCKKIESIDLPVLVGKPIDNTYIKILSEENVELPAGFIGEVCIGGIGVALGYHKRLNLTKDKFISDSSGNIIYKTGDRGRIRSDLNLELFGRIDNQIKIRGYRVEPNEIETIINKMGGVVESVVKLQKISDTDTRLVAFINANSEFNETKSSILNTLRKELPEYMVPSSYHLVDEFPRTPNGKTDRNKLIKGQKELKLFDETTDNTGDTFSSIEKVIKQIWGKYIDVEKMGLNDNFFDLGGSSLTLLEVAKDINELTEYKIDIIDFFTHTTIKSISTLIQSQEIRVSNNAGINLSENLKNLAKKRKGNNNGTI